MGRSFSRASRDRVVATVEGGLSCRRAAARFGVSAASAIRWRLATAAGCQAPRRRPAFSPNEDHAGLIHAVLERWSGSTLDELRLELARHGVTTSIFGLWRFLARHEITCKGRRATQASRIAPT